MTWILSILSLSGIGAALFFIPGAAAKAVELLSALFDFARRYPWQMAVIALCALSAYLWHGRSTARNELAAIHAAQKDAGTNQAAVNHVPAAQSQAIAEKSNAEAPAYYDSVHRAAADHAIRVPNAHPISGPNLPRADSVEPGVHGPDATSDLVCRPAIEDSQIVHAAARGAEMRQEGLDLIELGVAVASGPENLLPGE